MDIKRKETKRKLKSIESLAKFNDILKDLMVSEDIKEMLVMYYIQCKPLSYIADFMGVSLVTVKRWHEEALEKLSKIV